ncbi:hypothetical protein ACFQAT_28740 [Undibacterium arcticum]|uniref:hypothetical protein n=1 Tax=Undibacterium arcticum TaxID=1762892 RepID=UPI00361FC9A1
MIVIDEAHLYLTDDTDHIINRLIREARKFGVGLLMASQAPSHFSDELLAGVAVRIVLGLDEFYWPVLTRKFGLDEKSLRYVVPRKRLIAQMKNAGELQSRVHWVNL